MSGGLQVHVYRSDKRADTYLLVREQDALERVPSTLLEHFGEPVFSFEFTLDDERSLQRIDAQELQQRLSDDGFYLQLPPPETLRV